MQLCQGLWVCKWTLAKSYEQLFYRTLADDYYWKRKAENDRLSFVQNL